MDSGGADITAGDAGSVGGEGGTLLTFAYPADPGAGAFYVTISGESNALTGYPFPPVAAWIAWSSKDIAA